MKSKEKYQILDSSNLSRVITRMTHEILERNKGAENIVILGMQTRGVILAKRISSQIKSLENIELAVGALDTTLYRDDYRIRDKQPEVRSTDISFSIDKKDVILVDDVLYTGRTVRAALDAITDIGRPKSIQLAVLLDRGHREFPIHADYVGKKVTTSQNEEIKLRVNEIDHREGVWLVEIEQ